MGALGGLGLMYCGICQIIGEVPFPLASENAAKLMGGLCAIIMCLGFLLISRSRKKEGPDDPQ